MKWGEGWWFGEIEVRTSRSRGDVGGDPGLRGAEEGGL